MLGQNYRIRDNPPVSSSEVFTEPLFQILFHGAAQSELSRNTSPQARGNKETGQFANVLKSRKTCHAIVVPSPQIDAVVSVVCFFSWAHTHLCSECFDVYYESGFWNGKPELMITFVPCSIIQQNILKIIFIGERPGTSFSCAFSLPVLLSWFPHWVVLWKFVFSNSSCSKFLLLVLAFIDDIVHLYPVMYVGPSGFYFLFLGFWVIFSELEVF